MQKKEKTRCGFEFIFFKSHLFPCCLQKKKKFKKLVLSCHDKIFNPDTYCFLLCTQGIISQTVLLYSFSEWCLAVFADELFCDKRTFFYGNKKTMSRITTCSWRIKGTAASDVNASFPIYYWK